MKTPTKIILGSIALVLIAQHQLGRYFFAQECLVNEGAWVKPIEPANSLAYDLLDAHYPKAKGFDATRPGSLIDDENRRAFVEFYIYAPSVESLSTESGWHRYWLARKGDPACAAFYAAKSLQAKWHANLTDPRNTGPRLDPDAICIASQQIETPESRYVLKDRSNVDLRMFGLRITRSDLIDHHTNEIRAHFQSTTYFGSWFYEGINWLGDHLADGGLTPESCRLPPERYFRPSELNRGPISTLGTLASEGWPMLPAATNPSK
jgi:hypothetical protein